MFHSARIKLTAWYLLIIMLVSIFFSVAVYEILTSELDRVERIQRTRIENRFPQLPLMIPPSDLKDELAHPFRLDPELIEETKNRLKIILVTINIVISGTSAIAGYFLAGRTLKPIKEMVDEQSRFITDSSHELRTPLTSLKSEIEVNLRNKKLTLDEAKKILTSNLEEVNNLQVLSDSLIKLTQYQKGQNDLTVAYVSLIDIIKKAMAKVSSLAKNKNITINNNKIKDVIVEGEESSLTEVFVILLDNAIKYSPKNSEITLRLEKTDNHVLIRVTDQGVGIDEQDIPHLFDRFFRADKSRTKSEVAGYGLGLAIAKQIIDRHHGLITVQSVPNTGTTFTVQIPIKHSRDLI